MHDYQDHIRVAFIAGLDNLVAQDYFSRVIGYLFGGLKAAHFPDLIRLY